MNITPEITRLVDEIRNDKTHGASQLARQAVQVLKTAAEYSQAKSVDQFLREQGETGQELMAARPAMAPLFNIVSRLLKIISEKTAEMDLNSVKQLTISKADEAVNDSLEAIARIASYISELITDGDRIMTHSYSSTVTAGLKEAFTKRKNIEVMVTRSGPGRSGESIVQELSQYGVPVTFIDDTAVGLYITTMNKVVIGADRICADGKVINGIGTYPLALAAAGANISFHVFCETLKFDARLRSDEVDLEEKETFEAVETEKLPPGVRTKNPCFDITPLELVTSVVTENGILLPKEVINCLGK